MKQVAESG